jgi:hypothetical protein
MRKGVLLKGLCFRVVVACLYAAFFLAHLLAVTPDTPRQPGTLPYFSYQKVNAHKEGTHALLSAAASSYPLNLRLNKHYHPENWVFIPPANIASSRFFPVPEKKRMGVQNIRIITRFRMLHQLRGPPFMI